MQKACVPYVKEIIQVAMALPQFSAYEALYQLVCATVEFQTQLNASFTKSQSSVLTRVNNGRESIQLPYTASKMSTSSREAIP